MIYFLIFLLVIFIIFIAVSVLAVKVILSLVVVFWFATYALLHSILGEDNSGIALIGSVLISLVAGYLVALATGMLSEDTKIRQSAITPADLNRWKIPDKPTVRHRSAWLHPDELCPCSSRQIFSRRTFEKCHGLSPNKPWDMDKGDPFASCPCGSGALFLNCHGWY
jgi:hypothetical protein